MTRLTPLEIMAARAAKAEAEIERLQEFLRGTGANRYWEGRWRDEVARIERLEAAFEQCARIAKNFKPDLDDPRKNQDQLAALIREAALAGKEGDMNQVERSSMHHEIERQRARIEQLEAENEHLRDSMMELAVQVRQLTEQIELHERAALAGKSHT